LSKQESEKQFLAKNEPPGKPPEKKLINSGETGTTSRGSKDPQLKSLELTLSKNQDKIEKIILPKLNEIQNKSINTDGEIEKLQLSVREEIEIVKALNKKLQSLDKTFHSLCKKLDLQIIGERVEKNLSLEPENATADKAILETKQIRSPPSTFQNEALVLEVRRLADLIYNQERKVKCYNMDSYLAGPFTRGINQEKYLEQAWQF